MKLLAVEHENILQKNSYTIPRTKEDLIRTIQDVFDDEIGTFKGSAHLKIYREVPPVKLPL